MHDQYQNSDESNSALPNALILTNNICQELCSEVQHFAKSQLGFNPDSVFLDEHNDSIIITLKNVLAYAERNCAKDRRLSELIVKTHAQSFKSVSGVLTSRCSQIIDKSVEVLSFFIDPESNYATIILKLGN